MKLSFFYKFERVSLSIGEVLKGSRTVGKGYMLGFLSEYLFGLFIDLRQHENGRILFIYGGQNKGILINHNILGREK